MCQFVADGSLRSMPGKYFSMIGQLGYKTDALYHVKHAPPFQINSPNRTLKQCVTRKHHALFPTLETSATGRMPRRMNEGESVVTKADGVGSFKICFHGRQLII